MGGNDALVDWKGFYAMFDLWKRSILARSSKNRSSQLLELIENFEHFECADARDRIYTLLTFATDIRMSMSQDSVAIPKNPYSRAPSFLSTTPLQ